jgi:hypothetical protein
MLFPAIAVQTHYRPHSGYGSLSEIGTGIGAGATTVIALAPHPQ